jgi:hypothetical protein
LSNQIKSLTFKAHFDGKVIVPDEPVDLPVDQPLEVELRTLPLGESNQEFSKWNEALERLLSRAVHTNSLSPEALRRENLYEERI